MKISQRIGIVGGTGWLGLALARAAVESGTVDARRLVLSSRSGKAGLAESLGAAWTSDNAELARQSDVIILSVRPDQFRDVKLDLAGKLVISVMAGVTSATIATKTNSGRVVRSMPNAAAAIRQSFTPWHAAGEVTAEDKALIRMFFGASGEAAEVSRESDIDYCAGLTGAGAAFPALLAEALITDAVSRGMAKDFAVKAAKGVLCGASQLFAGDDADTAEIVQEMIDYRGTTAAALQAMLDQGFNAVVAAGLEAAAAKSARMSEI